MLLRGTLQRVGKLIDRSSFRIDRSVARLTPSLHIPNRPRLPVQASSMASKAAPTDEQSVSYLCVSLRFCSLLAPELDLTKAIMILLALGKLLHTALLSYGTSLFLMPHGSCMPAHHQYGPRSIVRSVLCQTHWLISSSVT